MNTTFACPVCDRSTRVESDSRALALVCAHCEARLPLSPSAYDGEKLVRCLVCGGRELFVRKDFSPRLGLTIILSGFVAATITWYLHKPLATYAILGVSALLDFLLYFVVGNLLECYKCHAEYRGVPGLDDHSPFSLETHERYRQQAARLADAARAADSTQPAAASPPPRK